MVDNRIVSRVDQFDIVWRRMILNKGKTINNKIVQINHNQLKLKSFIDFFKIFFLYSLLVGVFGLLKLLYPFLTFNISWQYLSNVKSNIDSSNVIAAVVGNMQNELNDPLVAYL